MAVIAVIGILAAAATPSFVLLLRDRRVTEAARHTADLYRLARARAMGRGAAVMVRWNASAVPTNANPVGHFSVWEATAGPNTPGNQRLPSARCRANWVAGTNASLVTSFDERHERYKPATASFLDLNGTPQPYTEICFTPRGRAFFRNTVAGNFAALTGVPRVIVTNTESGMVRQVILPPTGAARVETKF